MSSVAYTLEVRLVAAAPRVPSAEAVLHYDGEDPFAVRMEFPAPATLHGTEVTWTFARELLLEGLGAPAGHGDVRLSPYVEGWTRMEFRAAEGAAVVLAPSRELGVFAALCTALVPPGEEHLSTDLDRHLAQALGDLR